MSNSNKTEINKRYGELVRKSISNVIDDTAYGMTGLNRIGNEVNHTYSNATTASDFTLTDVNTQPNRNYNYYTNVVDNVESLYPKIINCSPQYLTVEMKREMVVAMNALMKIKDVEIIVPNKVVKVTFDDNTFEKAVCHEDDIFSLETAITICMTKHLLGGSGKFNNILAKGVKIVEDKLKAKKEAEQEEKRKEAKRKKNHDKLMKRIAKREELARNARIQEMAEAIKLAKDMTNVEGV